MRNITTTRVAPTIDPEVIHRHWIVPAPDRDEYSLYIVRYLAHWRPRDITGGSNEYLAPNGSWKPYGRGDTLEPFCRWDGRTVNPYVGTEDWRNAVADVINEEIAPAIESLLMVMRIASERVAVWTPPTRHIPSGS